VILFVVSFLRIICLVRSLIALVSLCVMLALVQKLTNFHIRCLQELLLLLSNLFIQMFGVLPFILLVERNIMSVLLMIIINLHGFNYYAKNLRSPNISLNFRSLLSVCLIARSLTFNLIGGEEYEKILFSGESGFLIRFLALTLNNKMVLLSRNIDTLLRWVWLFLLMLLCP
jgi:hypothetical protein